MIIPLFFSELSFQSLKSPNLYSVECLQFSLKKNQYPSICITWGRSCRLMVFHMTLQDEYAIIFNPHRTQRSRPSRKLLEHPPFHTCEWTNMSFAALFKRNQDSCMSVYQYFIRWALLGWQLSSKTLVCNKKLCGTSEGLIWFFKRNLDWCVQWCTVYKTSSPVGNFLG